MSSGWAGLFGEYLAHVAKRLEFQRIARRIEEEHGGLFTGLALEADMRLDDEAYAGGLETVGQRLPLVHGQDGAEMAHRHVVAIHRIARAGAGFFRREMRHHLVAIEIEIDPGVR